MILIIDKINGYFNIIFSPVVRLTTIRVVLRMYVAFDLHLEQLDVKTVFLHGELEEEIYMLQPKGFKEQGKENLVCRLTKSLYIRSEVGAKMLVQEIRFLHC